MNLGTLLTSAIGDTLDVSLPLFRVELALAATVVMLLLCRMLPSLPGALKVAVLLAGFAGVGWHLGQLGYAGQLTAERIATPLVILLLVALPLFLRIDAWALALGGAGVALWFAWNDLRGMPGSPWTAADVGVSGTTELFGGLLVFDSLTAFVRLLLAGFLVLYVLFTTVSGIPDREDGADFHVLVFGAALGMCLMASANHLLMVFMAVEMASVPSYALAGLLKGRKASSEAALKYAVYGAGTAGVMLYGISLLGGTLGTFSLPGMATALGDVVGAGSAGEVTVLCLGGLMLAVGLAFKLSAVPFHFWCPDVFEGAAAEVGAFLSVASKAAAVALLLRVALTLGDPSAAAGVATSVAGLAASRQFMAAVIGMLAAVTCTLGNLAAYGQTNMKRLLAYSTIAHAGYLMMGAAAAVALSGVSAPAAQRAVGGLAFYLAAYLFMNLAAFAIVALLRNRLRSEEISAYAGLVRTSLGIVVAMVVVLVSLIGLPPMAGFVAKFQIFASLAEAWQLGAARPLMLALLVVGGVNTVVSLFYYLRVVKVMTIDPPPADRADAAFPLVSLPGAMVTALAVPVLVFGIFWSGLNETARFAGSFVARDGVVAAAAAPAALVPLAKAPPARD
ncbi:MAG: NADH-quinone oxidoreductase subunit N [Planctomycetia bacterium]